MGGGGVVFTWWWLHGKSTLPFARRKSFKEILVAFKSAFWALLMPVIIVGGLKFGIFTPAETGAVVAFMSLVVGIFVYRELKPRMPYTLVLSDAKSTAVMMFLVAAALVSAWLLTIS